MYRRQRNPGRSASASLVSSMTIGDRNGRPFTMESVADPRAATQGGNPLPNAATPCARDGYDNAQSRTRRQLLSNRHRRYEARFDRTRPRCPLAGVRLADPAHTVYILRGIADETTCEVVFNVHSQPLTNESPSTRIVADDQRVGNQRRMLVDEQLQDLPSPLVASPGGAESQLKIVWR